MRTDSAVYPEIVKNAYALGGRRIDSEGLTPHSDPVIPPPFSSPFAGTNWDLDALRREQFDRLRFPSADLVGASADLFPTPYRRQARSFEKVLPNLWSESAHGFREGSWPILEIGPGMLRFRRRDAAARDRAANRSRAFDVVAGQNAPIVPGSKSERRDAARRAAALLDEIPAVLSPLFAPSDFRARLRGLAPLPESIDAADAIARYRAAITEWSRRSQSNLIRTILSLDLAAMLDAGRAPVMLTLTLPDAWSEITPDGAAAQRLFDRFRRRWAHEYGRPAWIWKREFQDRGAPHWHIWVVPPTEDLGAFTEWVRSNWTATLGLTDPAEYRKSLRHGTHVSIAEGLRAADPKRLALYFLKESGPVAVKAYQNRVPVEWVGGVVGRFWGVAGISKAVRSAELSPEDMDRVWRTLRKIREAHSGTRVVTVDRIDSRTGVIRRRKVRRRLRVRQSAGWVALNDAPAVASQIARWITGDPWVGLPFDSQRHPDGGRSATPKPNDPGAQERSSFPGHFGKPIGVADRQ